MMKYKIINDLELLSIKVDRYRDDTKKFLKDDSKLKVYVYSLYDAIQQQINFIKSKYVEGNKWQNKQKYKIKRE